MLFQCSVWALSVFCSVSLSLRVQSGTLWLCLQVGRILQRDREKCQAMVQLERDEERLHTLDYDSVCHYLGAVDN